MKLSESFKLRALLLFNFSTTFLCLFYFSLPASYLVASLVYGLLLNLIGNNIGLHRYFSHSSFETAYRKPLLALSTLCCLGSQISYSAIHRSHHKFSGTDKDPHCPKRIGLIRSLFMSYNVLHIEPTIVKSLLKQDDLRFIHKHYYLLLLLIILVLISIDFAVLVLAFSLPALLCWVSAVSVGIIPHLNKEGTVATNSVLTALLSTGEGWHLNHHQSPRDYQQGRTWWQIDVAAILIRILKVKDDKS